MIFADIWCIKHIKSLTWENEEITKVCKTHSEGNMSICTKFHGNLLNLCLDNSVWLKVVDQVTDYDHG